MTTERRTQVETQQRRDTNVHGTIESLFRVEWRPLVELAALVPEWSALAERALEPNVFYEPAFALAAAPVLGADAGAVLVWSAEPRRLVGFFPCRVETRRYGIRLPLLAGWTHPYGPLGTPLVDRDAADEAVAAFLNHVADDPGLPKLLLMSYMVEDGPVCAAFARALVQRDAREARFGRHRRALLAPGDQRADYMNAALTRKRSKKLARQRRRLAEAGEVAATLASDPNDVARAMEDFFAIEARGWKGAAGTAAAQMPAIRQFMIDAAAGLARDGQARVARLVHDGHAIAAGVLLQSGAGAWFWKIAYDETAARASPGVQLTLDLTDTILRDPGIAWCDSCATPDHAMIDRLWRERRPMVDRLIALAPGFGFMVACRLEGMRRGMIQVARRAREIVRR